jgi:hypothetical protein
MLLLGQHDPVAAIVNGNTRVDDQCLGRLEIAMRDGSGRRDQASQEEGENHCPFLVWNSRDRPV